MYAKHAVCAWNALSKKARGGGLGLVSRYQMQTYGPTIPPLFQKQSAFCRADATQMRVGYGVLSEYFEHPDHRTLYGWDFAR